MSSNDKRAMIRRLGITQLDLDAREARKNSEPVKLTAPLVLKKRTDKNNEFFVVQDEPPSPKRRRPGPNLCVRSPLDGIDNSKGSKRRSLRDANRRRESSSSEDEQPKSARLRFRPVANVDYSPNESEKGGENGKHSSEDEGSDILPMKTDNPISSETNGPGRKLRMRVPTETIPIRHSERKTNLPKKLRDSSDDETDESSLSEDSNIVQEMKDKRVSPKRNNPEPKVRTRSRDGTDNNQLPSSSKRRLLKETAALQTFVNALKNSSDVSSSTETSDIIPERKIKHSSPVLGLKLQTRSQQDGDSCRMGSPSKRKSLRGTNTPEKTYVQRSRRSNDNSNLISKVEMTPISTERNGVLESRPETVDNNSSSKKRRSLRGTKALETLLDASDEEFDEISSDGNSDIIPSMISASKTPPRESAATPTTMTSPAYAWKLLDPRRNRTPTGLTPKRLDLGDCEEPAGKQLSLRLVKCDVNSPLKNTDKEDSVSPRVRSRPGSNLSMVQEEDEAVATSTRHRAATRLLSPLATAANGIDGNNVHPASPSRRSQQSTPTLRSHPNTPLPRSPAKTQLFKSQPLSPSRRSQPSTPSLRSQSSTPLVKSPPSTPVRSPPAVRSQRKGAAVTPQREATMTTPLAGKSQPGTPVSQSQRRGLNVTPSMPQREGTITTPATPMEEARAMLHVSAVPKELRCREAMSARIRQFLEARLEDQSGGAMYISGVPGTGKTATVRKVIGALQLEYTFPYVEVNGMRMTTPHQLYVQIHDALAGVRLPWEQALRKLEARFTDTKKPGAILLVDELDLICNHRQDVVYNLLDWPRRSRLVVITIANTMDLPERLMQGKVASRLGLSRVVFKPYSSAELEEIVTARLLGIKAFEQDAVRFVAKKVASISGDCRRALDICRRATEVAESQSASASDGRSRHEALVTMEHVQLVLDEMMSSYKVKAIKGLSRMEQLFLRSVASSVDPGTEETNFTKVFRDLLAYCTLDGVKAATPSEALGICSRLSHVRLLICQGGRKAVRQKILLNCDPDDIHYALNKT